MLFVTGTVFAKKTGYSGKPHFGVAPQAQGGCTFEFFLLAFGLSGHLLDCKCVAI